MPQTDQENKCPRCGEPVKSGWRICPACETRLQPFACPLCDQPVKENWKRCPECEALLICAECHRRLPRGAAQCPACQPGPAATEKPAPQIIEPVCQMTLIHVDRSTFQMGDTFGVGAETEQPVHRVELDDFYIGRFPVTQVQWSRLMTENPSRFEGPDRPVEQVTWDDAREFARKLSHANQDHLIFRLPTEAEWELAARSGGKDERYAGGDDIDVLAWYEENSEGRTQPVGTRAPNGLGLYDMSGNVWEWCEDAFLPDAYQRHKGRNPLVESRISERVIRGGSWNLDAWSARCARRFNFTADFFGPALGFRLVMIPARSV